MKNSTNHFLSLYGGMKLENPRELALGTERITPDSVARGCVPSGSVRASGIFIGRWVNWHPLKRKLWLQQAPLGKLIGFLATGLCDHVWLFNKVHPKQTTYTQVLGRFSSRDQYQQEYCMLMHLLANELYQRTFIRVLQKTYC